MDAPDSHDVFFHVRILIGVVLGLALTRVLSGIARIVQHPGQKRLYFTHLVWVVTILVSVIHFWWWEFGLSRIHPWQFELFLFVLFYAFLYFLLASLLFPDAMDDYEGYEAYFLSRRRWFFGLLATTFLVDIADTLVKGRAYFDSLGPEYPIRLLVTAALCGVAAWTADRRFHRAFALIYLAYLLSWIMRAYRDLG